MKYTLFLLLLLSGVSAYSSAPRGILNVEIQSSAVLKGSSRTEGPTVITAAIPEKRRFRKDQKFLLSCTFPDDLSGKWQKRSLSFIPETDGRCTLILKAAFNGKNRVHPFLHIDKVELQGAALKNPGFEFLDKKNVPLFWRGPKNASGKNNALEGKTYARVNYPGPISQEFTVRKNEKVTVAFYVRQESPLADTRGKDGMTNIYTDCDGSSVHISSGRLTLIPSFENCSYYINRTRSEWGKKCTVKVWYRKKGSKEWIQVLDPVNMEKEKAWRGSIMLLQEDSSYDFKAVISGEKVSELRSTFRTRNSNFKVARTIILNDRNFNGHLNNILSGTPDGYILYKAAPGFVLKGKKDLPGGVIECTSSRYVIFEGLTIDANGSRHALLLKNCQDIVVRNCNISNFGLFENVRDMKQQGRWTYKGKVMNYDGGIRIEGSKNTLVERCFIHSPNSTANAWIYSHPAGPSAVYVPHAKGGTVIRYNDFVGSDSKRWNDAIECNGNGYITGGFFRDSDIYGNVFAFSNDDSIEIEGGEMNIRFYGNRVQGSLSGVSAGSCRLGPSYQFRNLYYKLGDENNYKGCCFKNGHGNQGDGALFFINNSVFSPGARGAHNFPPHSMPPAYNPPLKAFSRNNILLSSSFIAKGWFSWNIDFDNDLFYTEDPAALKQQAALAREAKQEKNALLAFPGYVDPENGDLRLKKDSPARNRAVAIPGLPVRHPGAFQDDGLDIPFRPIPVNTDRKEVNFTPENRKSLFRFTMTAGGKNFSSSFKVHCNDSFFTVTPVAGKIRSGEKITFSVTLKNSEIKGAKLHNGMAVIRFADGFSRVVSVYADFRNDKTLQKANRKNLIPIKHLRRSGNIYKGSVTVPVKGCYFLFADTASQHIGSSRVSASFGKIRNDSRARFSTIRPGLGLLYTGSFSGCFFFLEKGTYPFTFENLDPKHKISNFFITAHPEEILR